MSAVTDWCKPVILLIAIVYFYGVNIFPSFAVEKKRTKAISDRDYLQDNYQRLYWLAQKTLNCLEINREYREVYSFETENYYINVCQLEEKFYYHRHSKDNTEKDLLIPAEKVFGGNIFQATDGKTIYFVGKDGDRYYSSVMQNDNEIVFEPELIRSPPVFPTVVSDTIDFSLGKVRLSQPEEYGYITWKLDSLVDEQNNTENPSICTKDRSTFDPSLEGWQSLLGKTADVANLYATNLGHNFVYDRDAPDRALIRTQEGTIINLNIATTSETIERICIQPVAENF